MLLASGVLFFWAAFNGPDDRRHLRRIGWVLVGVGFVVACLLYSSVLFGDEALFWVTRGLDPDGVAGFPTHNRYAGFLNACIGAGWGLIFEAVARRPASPAGPGRLGPGGRRGGPPAPAGLADGPGPGGGGDGGRGRAVDVARRRVRAAGDGSWRLRRGGSLARETRRWAVLRSGVAARRSC